MDQGGFGRAPENGPRNRTGRRLMRRTGKTSAVDQSMPDGIANQVG
jgi:hypothetical protein